MNRKIIHIDCDCFFAAVEMRDNPALQHVPLAIGGSSDRRGVISTANYVARKYGVRSAMPTKQALQLCPDLVLHKGSYEKYKAVSQQIFEILHQYTEKIQVVSIDEAYLDVTEVDSFHNSATLIAQAIKAHVKEKVGITVSAGVAPNKFLAKVASDWRKPDGLFVIKPEEVPSFVKTLPVQKISGVGKVTSEKLRLLGIETCGDIADYPLDKLIEKFGKFANRLRKYSVGEDDRPVHNDGTRKSCSVERTFASDISFAEMLEKLPALIQSLSDRLSKYKGISQKSLFVKMKFSDFHQTTVEHVGMRLSIQNLHKLLKEANQRHTGKIRLVGIGIKFNQESLQLPLFDEFA